MPSTFTLTGTLYHDDGVTPVVNSSINIKAAPYPDTTLKLYYTRGVNVVTDANGHFSQSLVTATGLYYTIRSTARHPAFTAINFAAPTAGTTVDITALTTYDPTGAVPGIYTQTVAARDAAIAAAAGVQTNNWAATTAYSTGQTVRAPDGSAIKRTASGTSRATFDATERALWTTVSTTTGTLEQVALDGRFQQIMPVTLAPAPAGGTTDDLAAVQAVLTAVGTAGGGLVLLRAGTYLLSNTLVVPNKVTLRGIARSATVLKAHSTFPTTGAALVNLGPSGLAFASRVERMSLDCDNVAGSVGIYSFQGQEFCGTDQVTINNFKDTGLHMDTGAADFALDNIECYPSSTGANYGIHLHNAGSNIVRKATCGVSGALTVGIYINGGEAVCQSVHIENCVDGILYDNARGFVYGVSGPTVATNVTNLVRQASNCRYLTIIDATKNSATNTFKDDFYSRTITDAFVQCAVLGDQYVARLHHVGDQLGFFNRAPISKLAALTATVAAAPAGGTGTAAGAWDTSANRDAAIATINNLKTRVDQLEARLNTTTGYGLIPG